MPPRVLSIVMPVKGQQRYTYGCLQSIRSGTSLDYEVLIIDSPSDDRFDPIGFTEPMDAPLLVEYVAEERTSLYGLCNRMAARSNAEFIAILNNDIVVGPRTLDNLVEGMRKFKLDSASPVTTDASDDLPMGFAEEALGRSRLPCELLPRIEGTGSPWRGWFMMLSSVAWEELGGFDDRFVLWYGDDDFFRRLDSHEMLRPTQQIANTYVHHFQSKTPRPVWWNADDDKRLFEEKWGLAK